MFGGWPMAPFEHRLGGSLKAVCPIAYGYRVGALERPPTKPHVLAPGKPLRAAIPGVPQNPAFFCDEILEFVGVTNT
jgi:hypothetical protein